MCISIGGSAVKILASNFRTVMEITYGSRFMGNPLVYTVQPHKNMGWMGDIALRSELI